MNNPTKHYTKHRMTSNLRMNMLYMSSMGICKIHHRVFNNVDRIETKKEKIPRKIENNSINFGHYVSEK